jgi:hypothetical protein
MNCVIYKKGSDEITHLVLDCYKRGNNFIGSNIRLFGIKPNLFDHMWTRHAAQPVADPATGRVTGWNKKVSDLDPAKEKVEVRQPDHAEVRQAVKHRLELSRMSPAGLDLYIDLHVTDLASAREFLKMLCRAVLGVITIQDQEK